MSGNSDSPPLPPLAGLLQGSLSPGAPPASLVGIGAGLARIRRAGFGEAGVDAFGLTLRFDSPARVRSSIVASGASFLMERIPAMADALASYASEVAITCPLGERRTKRNFPVVPFLITSLPGISAPFPAARLRRSSMGPRFLVTGPADPLLSSLRLCPGAFLQGPSRESMNDARVIPRSRAALGDLTKAQVDDTTPPVPTPKPLGRGWLWKRRWAEGRKGNVRRPSALL